MVITAGLIVLLIVAVVGALRIAGPTHPLTESVSVLGRHVTGSTGTLVSFGILVGVVALLGLSVLLASTQAWQTR